MTEQLNMTPPTAANPRKIKERHEQNVRDYGEQYNGLVPTAFMKKEALDAMYEAYPERREYPLRIRRYAERIYRKDFKKDIQRAYNFKHVDMKRLKKQYGHHLARLAPELVDVPNKDLFAFVDLVKNEVVLQGCYNTNHYNNENPNHNSARRTKVLLEKEKERRAKLTPEEQQTLMLQDLMEVKDLADGTDGAK